jgi:hypothetical protein
MTDWSLPRSHLRAHPYTNALRDAFVYVCILHAYTCKIHAHTHSPLLTLAPFLSHALFLGAVRVGAFSAAWFSGTSWRPVSFEVDGQAEIFSNYPLSLHFPKAGALSDRLSLPCVPIPPPPLKLKTKLHTPHSCKMLILTTTASHFGSSRVANRGCSPSFVGLGA